MSFDPVTLALLAIILIIQLVATQLKNKYKRGLKSEFARVSESAQSDEYLDYYKHMQLVDIYRVIATLLLVGIIMWRTDSNIVQALAIAVGAIILVFQTLILSFVIYLMLLPQYTVGETIKIGALGEGEIITIKPLHIGLAGRNKSGEHTGEFYLIPNNKVRENPIIRVDYNLNAYQKIVCMLYYDKQHTEITLEEYMDKLTAYLTQLLPMRTAKNIGHYKSYIGHRYKLSYDMNPSGVVEISIGFIVKQRHSDDIKRQIYSFVQGL